MAVRVQDTILPKNDADFPVVDSGHVKGGHHEVANATARDAISAALRSVGMKVVTQNDGKTWQLDSNATTWTEFTGGGGGGTLAGDVTGPSGTNIVSAIQGLPVPDPGTKAEGALFEAHTTTHTISVPFTAPTTIVADSTNAGVFYVGDYDYNHQTPVLSKFTIAAGTVTASEFLDISLAAGATHIWGIYDLAEDANYIYVALNRGSNVPVLITDGGWVAIVDKATFTVVGWATVSTKPWDWKSICADGAGNFYVFDYFSQQISKYHTANHIGQAPANAVPPVVTEVGAAHTFRIRFGGGKVWATNWASGGAVVRQYDPTTLTITASLADFDGGGVVINSQAMVYDPVHSALWVSGWDNVGPNYAYYKVEQTGPGVIAVTAGPVYSTGAFVDPPPAMAILPSGNGIGTVSAQGPYVGFINSGTATWVATTQTNANLFDQYMGIATDALNAYMVAPYTNKAVSTIDYLTSTLTSGTITPAVIPPTWALRFAVPAGDVTGNVESSVVSAIHGIPSMDPSLKTTGDVVELHRTDVAGLTPTWTSPRALISDGTYLYVGQSSQGATPSSQGTIFRVSLSGAAISALSPLNLNTLSGATQIRDMAQDATYLYAACWNNGNIAVIDKATFAVVGWAYTAGSAQSVCADGAGNFYVLDPNNGLVWKFSAAACLGNPVNSTPPNTTAAVSGRWVRFGGGKLWVTNGGSGAPNALTKIDAATMTVDLAVADINGNTNMMIAVYDVVNNVVWVADQLNASNSVQVHKVDPATLLWVATVTGAPVSPATQWKPPSGLEFGPDASGTPNAWLYVTGQGGKFGASLIGAINPATDTWEGARATSTVAGDGAEGIAVIGDYVYVARFDTGSLGVTVGVDYWNPVANTVGTIVGTSSTSTWGLRYSPFGGDLDGTPRAATVNALRGVLTPDPSTAVVGYTMTLAQTPTFTNPQFLTWDPVLARFWVPDFSILAVISFDPVTKLPYTIGAADIAALGGIIGLFKIATDENYVYALAATFGPGGLLVIDKVSGAIVGIGSISGPSALVLDGLGNVWVAAHNLVAKFTITSLVGGVGVAPAASSAITGAYDIAWDATTGFLYVSTNSNLKVIQLPPAMVGGFIPPLPNYTTPFGHSTRKLLVAFGSVWVGTTQAGVYKIDPVTMSGAPTSTGPFLFSFGTTFSSLAADATHVWAGDEDTNGVYTIDPVGNVFVTDASTTNGNDRIFGLAFDGSKMWASHGSLTLGQQGLVGINDTTFAEDVRYVGPFALTYTAGGGGGGVTWANDLLGSTSSSQTVVGLRSTPISNPLNIYGAGTTLWWNGSAWDGSAAPLSPGALFYWNGGSVGWGFLSGGDLTGTFPTWTVAKINGGTAPATPLIGDVGKVIGVTAAGTYGLVTAGGSVAGPQTGNNYAPVKVNISGAAVQSWINLNGGTGFRTDLKDGDVDGVLQASQVSGAVGAQRKTAGLTVSVLEAGDAQWSYTNAGKYLQTTGTTSPMAVSYDYNSGMLAISRSGSNDILFQPITNGGHAPYAVSLEADLIDDSHSYVAPTITGKMVLKGSLAYAVKNYYFGGSARQSIVEVDGDRATARKKMTIFANTREAFVVSADKNSNQAGDSDAFGVMWQGFGNNYYIQNLTYVSAVQGTVSLAGFLFATTITSAWCARPLGGTGGVSTSGRIYMGLDNGQVLEYNGNVDPPVFVRALSGSVGWPIVAITSAFFGSFEWLWILDSHGNLDQFDLSTNTLTTSLATGFTNAREMTITGGTRHLVMVNSTSVGRLDNPTGMTGFTTATPPRILSPDLGNDLRSVAANSQTVYVADANNGYWTLNFTSALSSSTWTQPSQLTDITGAAKWATPSVDFSDTLQYSSGLPLDNVLGGDRIGGAYVTSKAWALTPGKVLTVVLGSAPTEMYGLSSGNVVVSRPGSKDLIAIDPYTPTTGHVFPLTGSAFKTGGLFGDVVVSGICDGNYLLSNGSYNGIFAIDTTNRRLLFFRTAPGSTTTTGSPGTVHIVHPTLGFGAQPGVICAAGDGSGWIITSCGTTITCVDPLTRRQVWQVSPAIPSLGGTYTSIVGAGAYVYLSTDAGEVHQYNLATGAFIRTVQSSQPLAGHTIPKLYADFSNVYWTVNYGGSADWNRLAINATTIATTLAMGAMVTLDIAPVQFGNYMAVLTTGGVRMLTGWTGASPALFAVANFLGWGGMGTLRHVAGLSSNNFVVTDSANDTLWQFDITAGAGAPAPTALRIAGVVAYM
jgi:hypothetical protein